MTQQLPQCTPRLPAMTASENLVMAIVSSMQWLGKHLAILALQAEPVQKYVIGWNCISCPQQLLRVAQASLRSTGSLSKRKERRS